MAVPPPGDTPRVDGGPPEAAVPPIKFSEHTATALGTPCQEPTNAGHLCRLCDPQGRIVGVVLPADFIAVDAASPFMVNSGEIGTNAHRLDFAITVESGGLRAQVYTCPGCRRMIGWAAEVTSTGWNSLSAGLRSELQVSLGYAASPMSFDELRTPPKSLPANRPIACPDGART